MRFRKLRKQKMHERAFFPKRKHRHEQCNMQDLVRKSEQSYLDFQEASLWGGALLNFLQGFGMDGWMDGWMDGCDDVTIFCDKDSMPGPSHITHTHSQTTVTSRL